MSEGSRVRLGNTLGGLLEVSCLRVDEDGVCVTIHLRWIPGMQQRAHAILRILRILPPPVAIPAARPVPTILIIRSSRHPI